MATQRRCKHEHVLPPAPANLSSMTRIRLVSAILRFAFPLPPYQVGMLGNTVRSTSGDSIRFVPQVPQCAAQMMTQRCKSISPASYDQWQRMCRLVKAQVHDGVLHRVVNHSLSCCIAMPAMPNTGRFSSRRKFMTY